MSLEREALAQEGLSGLLRFWTHESLPPDTMVVLQELRIVPMSGVTSRLTIMKLGASVRFIVRQILLPGPRGMGLHCEGQLFTAPMDPASDVPS